MECGIQKKRRVATRRFLDDPQCQVISKTFLRIAVHFFLVKKVRN